MNLVTQLKDFLDHRGAQAGPFFLGEWLCSLDDQNFAALRTKMGKLHNSGDQVAADEVLSLAVMLAVAEIAKKTSKFKDSEALSWVENLRLALSFENFRRMGWMTLAKPLSIRHASKVAGQFTPEGRRAVGHLKMN